MQQEQPKQLLKKHALRITECRLDVLTLFLAKDKAVSFRDLENEFRQYDRVTLYRTLNSFEESGLAHKIPTDSGSATYGLCQDNCNAESHHHDHVHFTCDECGTVECIESQQVPVVELPGYQIKESNFLVAGTCKTCIESK